MSQLVKAGNPQAYLIDTTKTFNNGDMVKWNTSNNKLQPMAVSGDYGTFAGVAQFAYPLSSPIDNSNPAGLTPIMGTVQRMGVFRFVTTNGETYTHGVALKLGAAANQIALDASAGQIIGYVNLPDGSTVVGDGVAMIEVEIQPNFGSQNILSA